MNKVCLLGINIKMQSKMMVAIVLAVTLLWLFSIVSSEKWKAAVRSEVDSPAKNTQTAIDGAVNPELIPDRTAYSLLFRFIGNRQTEPEKKRIRAYLRHAGLGQPICEACPESQPNDTDLNALLDAAEEFYSRVSVLDRQAKEIKDVYWPTPTQAAMGELARLQTQKEVILADIVASLPRRLSANGIANLRRHIADRVKRKIKIAPNLSTLPGGPGWEARTPNKHH